MKPRIGVVLVTMLALGTARPGYAAQEDRPKKVVFLPGPRDAGHPKGTHEYEKTARLLQHCLDRSPLARELRTEVYPGGWPDDPKALDDADTIVLISSGADRRAEDHPLLVGDRLAALDKQMRRGCGLVAIHWTLFVPEKKGGEPFLDWIGGYFDYERGKPQGGRAWYSKIQTLTTQAIPATLLHPVARGLKRFEVREEFYYHLRFRPADPRFTAILNTRIPGEADLQTVAWAVQRKDGGRGFGFSGGHFFDNWQNAPYRTMVLNAIVWTAGLDVPKGGVPSQLPEAKEADRPIRALIITGHNHPAHDFSRTTRALYEVLGQDERFRVESNLSPEFLASPKLFGYDVVVMNYCNWEQPGLSEKAKKNLLAYLDKGGGLVIVHFANGAFHFSLPKAGDSDWPEWRTRICRRVWDHTPGKSGHDKYGTFTVHIARAEHPITQGMQDYTTTDELYFRQQGDEPITVLATARSQVTGKDEPMAFVSTYGKARVFQTVLGHSAEAILTPGTAALIRRGAAWAAGRAPADQVRLPGALAAGKFDRALDARVAYAEAAGKPEYRTPPFTVECWAKLDRKDRFNVLVANGPKESADHWEIYSYVTSGAFSAYLPGYTPAEVKSAKDVTDGRWHHLAMTFDGGRVKLYVDAGLVKDQPVQRVREGGPDGPLWIGAYPPVNIGCDGLVDEVWVRKGLHPPAVVPEFAPSAAEGTRGLWHFDWLYRDQAQDDSGLQNPARVVPAKTVAGAGPSSATGLDYAPADPRLKAVLIDRSPGESYVAIKADTEGRLFVGGREALFVFEPRPGGKYARRELFRFPPDSWIAGIELRGNDLYVLTAAALYLFPEGRVRREGLRPRRLVWGLPLDLHVSFHCLAWGPEGDLYLNHGDPLLTHGDWGRPDHWGHWTLFTRPEGTKVSYTGVGAVLKVRPDGSGLRVVATGLRGCFGLAFDRHWDLFTNDNDHESLPDRYTPARLLHVTPHVDFAWPRGWMASKSPDRADLVEPMLSAPGRGVPVGLAYYDEAYLPADYRHTLLQDRWDRHAIDRYPLRRRGATVAAKELPFLDGRGNARPIGVAVGRGGRVFATIAYMAGNEGSPRYVSDLVMITRADDPPESSFAGYDVTTADAAKLWAELSDPSRDRRLHAHVEIQRRGGDLLHEATQRVLRTDEADPAMPHLVWLAAAGGSEYAAAWLGDAAADAKRPEVRRQALRALAALPALQTPFDVFRRALRDGDPPDQLTALAAFFDRDWELPFAEVAGLAASEDLYLRQAATRLLAKRAPWDRLRELCAAPNERLRLAGVLAAGVRLTTPPASPPPGNLKLAYREPSAFFRVTIRYGDAPDQPIDLRKLGPVGSFTTADYWKAAPPTPDRVMLFLALRERLADVSEPVKLQAAYWLSLLRDARTEPAVAKTYADVQKNRLARAPSRTADALWLLPGLEVKAPVLGPAAIDLSAEHQGAGGKSRWAPLTSTGGAFQIAPDAGSVAYAYVQVQSATRQQAVLRVPSPRAVKLWYNGRLVWQRPAGAGDDVLLDLQPGSNDLLFLLGADGRRFAVIVSARAPAAFALPQPVDSAVLGARLKAGGPEKVGPEFATIDWPAAARQGDAANGRKLFGTLGCVKCHAITADQQGGGGPSLAEAGKRFTVPYLVESILLPSKQVAEPFHSTRVVTTAGEIVTGLVVGETADTVELLLPDTTRRTLRKADVEERTPAAVSPMPPGLVRTPAELRDLLAYLLSDRPLPP